MIINTDTKGRKYDDILTVDELMDFLAVGRSTAYGLLRSGQIKCMKIGRVYKIPKENVLHYVSMMQN
jgi:excisionase family DNA binding protein